MKNNAAKKDSSFTGHIALLVAQTIFGINAVVSKLAMQSELISSKDLTFWRMFGAMILMWIASLFTKREKVSPKDLLLLFFASALGVSVNQSLYLKGLELTTTINASLIVSLSPIITMILSAIILSEPITWRKAGGVTIGAIGAAIIIIGGRKPGAEGNIIGDLLCIGSVTSFALYLTLFRDLIRKYSSITLMKWMFLFAAVCLLPFCYKSLSPALICSLPIEVLLEALYVVAFATFFSYMLIPIGQQRLRPTIVSMYNNIQPIVASIVVVIIGIGTFGIDKGIATALIIGGVYLTTTSRAKAE